MGAPNVSWTEQSEEDGLRVTQYIVRVELPDGQSRDYGLSSAGLTIGRAADNDVSLADGNLSAALGDLSAGVFVDDYDIYVNGQLQLNGANAAANNDVYPGTSLAAGQLKFEFTVKVGDVICVIKRV